MQKIKHWVKNHRKTTIGTAIVLVLLIGMGIINKIKQNKAALSSRYVVAKVAKTTPLTLTGTVAAQQQQVLSLPSGKVQSIGVANGQKVSEGDPLVTTYSESANEELTDAKQELAKAQRNVCQCGAKGCGGAKRGWHGFWIGQQRCPGPSQSGRCAKRRYGSSK